jgi:type VI secretion system protein ImpK
MREPEKNRDLIEVIQYILDRGFTGRYRFAADGQHQIEAIRAQVHDAMDAEPAHTPAGLEPAPATLPRRPIPVPDARRQQARWKLRRWLAIGGLCLALLAVAGGVAYWRYTQTKPAEPAMPPIDVLATRLTGRLANEVSAGTVTLGEKRTAHHAYAPARGNLRGRRLGVPFYEQKVVKVISTYVDGGHQVGRFECR